ncbi:MAG: threonine--tRNA ligase, partial [Mollicutes bacterium]|nr:threonine--tRNA ligase [Mollicutes bacterium]
ESHNIRINLDDRDEKLSYRMRESQIKKYPYSIIVGDREIEDNLISYRRYGTNETITATPEEFITMITDEINNKK